MTSAMTRIRPPAQARYPVQVETCHFTTGQQVAKGDPLYVLRDAEGRRLMLRAPADGILAEGPVPEGAMIPEGMPVAGLRPLPRDDRPEAGGEAQDALAATDPAVLRAVEREREATPSAFLRSIWTADSPDVRWGGAGPVLRMVPLFLALLLGLQLLLRGLMPDLRLEELLLPAVIIDVLALVLTLRAVRRWRRRPSPLGLILPVMALAMAGLLTGLLPDREIDRATGFDPAELPRDLAAALRGPDHDEGEGTEVAGSDVPNAARATDAMAVPSATGTATGTGGTQGAMPRTPPDDPQIMPPGCYLQVFAHCNRPYSDQVPQAMVIRFDGQTFPKELCGEQILFYSYYPHIDSHDTNMPAGHQREMRERIEDFREELPRSHPECRMNPDTTVTLNIRSADMMDEFSRTCWNEPVAKNYNTPICARF